MLNFIKPVYAVIESPSELYNATNGLLPEGNLKYIQTRLIPTIISLLVFLVIVSSLIFLLVGGLSYITSNGNKEGVAKARATITSAIIGLFLGLGSYIILAVLGSIL